jgi:hypothetical protein
MSSIDIISDGSESVSQISESEQEIGSIISGQDVIDRLEEFFPEKIFSILTLNRKLQMTMKVKIY